MITKQQQEVLKLAGKIDQETKQLAEIWVKKGTDDSLRQLVQQLVALSKQVANPIFSQVLQQIYLHLGSAQVTNIVTANNEQPVDSRTLSELLAELDALTGLSNVKAQVHDLIGFQKVQQLRKTHNLKQMNNTLHIAFLGNPGTGKTTVARIIGHVYRQLGLLSSGHFIEAGRTDLIAGYQGQTAEKVKQLMQKAKGGVLFLDEAYSITENDAGDAYGKEAITELIKALEDYRDDLVVIVAGYEEPMQKFFAANPGLRSRFNNFITFDDYSTDELRDILQRLAKKEEYVLTPNAEQVLAGWLKQSCENKDETFANARVVRNLFDKATLRHARRVAKLAQPTKHELMTIDVADVAEFVVDAPTPS